MTAIRSSLQNSFETQLTAEMGPNDLTAQVTTIGALTSPCYVTIDPDSDTLREYIFFDGTFTATSFVTSNIAKRYLAGSAAGSNLTHPIGAFVRVTPMAQHIEDLHDLIAGLDHGNDLAGLADDDHPQYYNADRLNALTLATQAYADAAAAAAVPAGVIEMFGGDTAPLGYLMCNGQAVSRATYADLFAELLVSYGDGDGSTTFNVPDLRGRFPLGKAASGVGDALGETGGDITPTVNISHAHTMPTHTHTINHGHADTIATASAGAHTHTMPTHIHTMPSHAHTVNIDHNHAIVTSSSDGHSHATSDTSGGPSSTTGPFANAGTTYVASSTHTHYVSDTTSTDTHSHTVDLPALGTTNITSSSVDPGNTYSTDPGDTNSAGAHTHSVTGGVTDHSGSSGATDPGNTHTGGSTALALPLPPFQVVNFIIKT
ncbi:MAG: phage tail protein [Actinomycetota bacterium]